MKVALIPVALAFALMIGLLAWKVLPEISRDREHVMSAAPGSVGGRRAAVLEDITEDYAASHPDASAKIAAGDQLAPESYLNKELAQRGAKWRVRDKNGTVLKAYPIS